MASLPGDFKSPVSTDFTTAAQVKTISGDRGMLPFADLNVKAKPSLYGGNKAMPFLFTVVVKDGETGG